MRKLIILFGIITFIMFSCKNGNENKVAKKTVIRKKIPVQEKPKNVSYTLESTKEWLKKNKKAANLEIAIAVNRTDKDNFVKMDSVIIPTDLSGDIVFYLPVCPALP
jgi:hypothetical protein